MRVRQNAAVVDRKGMAVAATHCARLQIGHLNKLRRNEERLPWTVSNHTYKQHEGRTA